ncbi:MAG: glycosyltransferase family 2 protein, partial [Clostridia bacterium]
MEKNLVSIITPVYNGEKYIEKCIESVLNQTYKNLEMIIVDDGSIDNSENIIKKYTKENSFIKYIKLKENRGISNARNVALKNATGRFVAFLDCDDIYYKDKIKKQVNFMIENNYFFTYTSYNLIDENGQNLNKIICAKEYENYKSLLRGNNIGCLTVMIDRLKINENLIFSSNPHEDYILWLSILKNNNKAYGLNAVL